jgi:hypothetical protein
MQKFRNKIFNEEVFERYVNSLPSTKENSLIKNGLFTNVNKYKTLMSEQTGGYAVLSPIQGRLGGTPVNYDGNTNIPKGAERDTFFQRKVCYGRAMSWGEYDFSADITNTNFKAEAQEVRDYWDEQRQSTVLSILAGIFGMTGGVNGAFVTKHTYDITGDTNPNLGADSMNRANQKALGDKKAKFDIAFMHSMVSTNLEGLNLIEFLKYTDTQGIERPLQIGTYNGKLVIVDDEMPTTEVAETSEGAGDGYTAYTTYVFQKGFFEYENIGLVTNKAIELARDPYDKGGKTDLISRIREMVVPYLISYKGTGTVSPTNTDFATGTNWELANNDKTGSSKVYVDDKLIPLARIISRG